MPVSLFGENVGGVERAEGHGKGETAGEGRAARRRMTGGAIGRLGKIPALRSQFLHLLG